MEAPSIHHSHATPTNTSGQHAQQSNPPVDVEFSVQEEGIDVGLLVQSIGLRQETVLELLRVFISSSWKDVTLVEEGIRSGNTRQVAEAAHSIKGAALNFEFGGICAAARSLEMGAREDSLTGAVEAVDVIRSRLKAIARSIDVKDHEPVKE
jgi:HPt (histidine-containing phosphotransfer) domain-containing protein